MKEDEGSFYFLFFSCILRVPYSRAVSPLLVIDCIIPRVRYLCWFLISIVATATRTWTPKARRDAAGPLVTVWNGRYLNMFYYY